MKTVSILISVYNGEKYLDKCFQSISKQTFQNFEIICINDCSKDQSQKKLIDWKNHFGDKMQLIENSQNLGLTKSLNKALSLADGKYIARIDDDDWWHPEKLGQQVIFLDSHPDYGIVGSSYIDIDERLNKHFRKLQEDDKEIRAKIFKRNPFAHSTILAKRSLFLQVGGYNKKIQYGQDYDLWLRLLPLTKFHNIQEYLCYRNIAPAYSTVNKKIQMLQSIKTRAKYIRKYKYPFWHNIYLVEPLFTALSPLWLRKLKRYIY